MRALISLTTRSAIMRSRSDSSRPASTLAASPIDMRADVGDASGRRSVTPSENGLRRAPPHAGHGTSRM